MTKLTKLKETTFTLYGTPSTTLVKSLTWCNSVPKAKRNKPAKINGIVVTNTIEVFHDV